MPRVKPGPPCKVCGKPSKALDLCVTHHSRWLRHGHTERTRPDRWGERSSHEHKDRWVKVKQEGCCQRWREDFWGFAADLGPKPEKHTLRRRDKTQPHSPENTYWKPHTGHGSSPEYARNNAERLRRDRLEKPITYKAYDLKRHYGITIQDYDRMLEKQEGKCAICKGPPTTFGRLVVDHCHDTKAVRGLLCSHCNRALGGFRDNVDVVLAAAAYLEQAQCA